MPLLSCAERRNLYALLTERRPAYGRSVQRLAHMGAPEWRLGALDPLAPQAPTGRRRSAARAEAVNPCNS
jgi:hypothetical protein